MGFFLNIFSRSGQPVEIAKLPSGSFTVDKNGKVIASTLPQSFSQETIRSIGQVVQTTFRSAKDANVPLREFFVHFAGLKLTAREQRGGALIFLAPLELSQA